MKQKLSTMLTMLLAILVLTAPALAAPSDEGNACQIIRQEVARYFAEGGACPCPYHAANDGRLCGGRSAWAKRQGASPRCFISDGHFPPKPVIAIIAHHTRWPDPPACSAEMMRARPTPSRTVEMLPAGLPNSE